MATKNDAYAKKLATQTKGATVPSGKNPVALDKTVQPKPYGSNISNFDPTNAVHIQLADAGEEYARAQRSGDKNGMNIAAAKGQAIRAQFGGDKSSFSNNIGLSTFIQPTLSLDKVTNDLQSSTKAQIDSGTANINAARDQQLMALAKQLNDSVAAGDMSIRDAQDAYKSQQEQINQLSYNQQEVTDLSAQDRGIQNSMQYLGMQAGDNARNNQLVNQNMTTRDRAIADVKTRLEAIKNNNALDMANANVNAAYQSTQLAGNMNAQMYGKLADLGAQDFFTQRGYQHDSDMASLGQAYNKENMAIGQRNQEKNLAIGQHNQEKNMLIQHGYDKENMGIQFKNEMSKMAKGQEYDMVKIKENYRYDMKKIAQQFSNEKTLISKRAEAAAHQSADDFEKKLKEDERLYQIQLGREGAKYVPDSPEWKLKRSQMEEAHQAEMDMKYKNAVFEGASKAIFEDPYIKENGVNPPDKPKNYDKLKTSDPKRKTYDKQLEAYKRADNFLNGTAKMDNLMYVKPEPQKFGPPDPRKDAGGTGNQLTPEEIRRLTFGRTR